MKTSDAELMVAKYFDPVTNIVVPNISWGMFNHECDLLVLTKAGCAYEIEIKVNKYDLIKDKLKWHKHEDKTISRLYFAIPTKLMPDIEHIPRHAGVLEIGENTCMLRRPACTIHRHVFSTEGMYKIARLGAMRVWPLKKKIKALEEKNV